MSCLIDNGYLKGCSSVGGLEKVYLGTHDPQVTYDDTTDPDGIITALIDNPNAVDVYEFEQDMEFAGLEQTINSSLENGTVFMESVLSLKFIEFDAKLRNLILSMANAPLFAVVKSNAGHYYILGVENAGRTSEGSASLGVALGDMNGATISITWKSQNGASLTQADILNFDDQTPDPLKITVQATTVA